MGSRGKTLPVEAVQATDALMVVGKDLRLTITGDRSGRRRCRWLLLRSICHLQLIVYSKVSLDKSIHGIAECGHKPTYDN